MSSTSSDSAGSEELSVPRKALRTVSPAYHGRSDAEMNAIGLLYAAILAVLLVPLLPFALVVWVIWRLGRAAHSFVGGEEDAGREWSDRRGRTI